MKNFLLLLVASMAFHFTASAQRMEIIEHAAEYTNSSFGNAPTSNGLIFVKRCDYCDRTSVRFNANTRYFSGRTQINAKQAEALNGQSSTLYFDPKQRTVTRVIFRAGTHGTKD